MAPSNNPKSKVSKQDCEKAVHVYEELYCDMIRSAKQKQMTDYFMVE